MYDTMGLPTQLHTNEIFFLDLEDGGYIFGELERRLLQLQLKLE
jgi:hypothetical protein